MSEVPESLQLNVSVTTRLHLVSMPWAAPMRPSIQSATLRAFLEALDIDGLEVIDHSPFMRIPIEAAGAEFDDFFRFFSRFEERAFLLLYLRRYGVGTNAALIQELLSQVNQVAAVALDDCLTEAALDILETATQRYLDTHVVPLLAPKALNCVAFTCNYDQVYASFYAQRYLESRLESLRCEFLYGGASTSLPQFQALAHRLRIEMVAFIGEGEGKLAHYLQQRTESWVDAAALRPLVDETSGTYSLSNPVDLYAKDRRWYSSQLPDLSALPLPDYGGYFAEAAEFCADAQALERFKSKVTLMMEGSRGCFANCDFCGLNYTWDSFRKMDARPLLARVQAMARKYQVRSIFFADNVCDTWAEAFAEQSLEAGLDLEYFMELRSHHNERFWALLGMAGVTRMQIGIEALAPELMKCIGKGTRVSQNLLAHRTLTELGVHNSANLITHHPKSTQADVAGTKAILSRISHLQPFNLSPFALVVGSQIYSTLSDDVKRSVAHSTWFRRLDSSALSEYLIDWRLATPTTIAPAPAVLEAWDEFTQWYLAQVAKWQVKPHSLAAYRLAADAWSISESRDGVSRSWLLEGPDALLYEAAYEGVSMRTLLERFPTLAQSEIRLRLGQFEEMGILCTSDDLYIALARRSREAVIAKWFGPKTLRRSTVEIRVANNAPP